MILRACKPKDAQAMCDLINPIIQAGGTTAHRQLFDPARMTRHYISAPLIIACTTAWVDDELYGFQSLEWADPDVGGAFSLPSDWGVIATFVRREAAQKGVGSALFAQTRMHAARAGVSVIDATIRTENTGGQRYYAKMGFVSYREDADSISRRFDIGPNRATDA